MIGKHNRRLAAFCRLLREGDASATVRTMSETDIDRYNAEWTDAAFVSPFNLSELPAIPLPLAWSAAGPPVSLAA